MMQLIRDLAAWLARPRLASPSGLRAPGAWGQILRLLALYVAVLILVLLPLLALWQKTMGLSGPDAFKGVSKAMLVPFAVLIAPVLEELGFRGWLTGRVRALWLLACGFMAGGLLMMVSMDVAKVPASLGVLAMALIAPAGWWWLRGRGVVPGFARAFPVLVWLSILLFGLSHLGNYAQVSLDVLPMVLPQLWAGMVLSYTRMRVGIVGSVLVHAMGNATALGLALMGG